MTQCLPADLPSQTGFVSRHVCADDYDDGGFDGGDDGGYYSADEGEGPADLPAGSEAAAAEGGAAEQVGRVDKHREAVPHSAMLSQWLLVGT